MCDKKYKVHTEKADWRQCLRIQWELWVNVIRRFSDMGEEEQDNYEETTVDCSGIFWIL